MPQFLVTIQLPDNYDPSLEDEAMIRDINALNEELDAAGARVLPVGWNQRAWRSHCASSLTEKA